VSRQTVSGQATTSFLCVHRYMWLTLYVYVNCRIPAPFSSVYHASKAAAVMFSDHQRIKLAPFGITVIDLKAGWVKSNFHRNRSDESRLPKRSIYEPMRVEAERAIRAEHLLGGMDLDVWAEQVLEDLLRKDSLAQV
jgi:1-acylglycerone phosphate reductase